jgi:hypothetical protein
VNDEWYLTGSSSMSIIDMPFSGWSFSRMDWIYQNYDFIFLGSFFFFEILTGWQISASLKGAGFSSDRWACWLISFKTK